MTVTITSNIINLYLNAGLIYGSEGVRLFINETIPELWFMSFLWGWVDFPVMGVKGAALSTLIASFAWLLTIQCTYFQKYKNTLFCIVIFI